MPTVDIPGVGLVEFPEDYTGERLNTAAKGVYLRGQQLSARAEGEQPASSQGLDALSRLPAGVQSGTGRTLAGAVRAGDIAATPTFIPFMGGLGPGAETVNRLNQQMPAVREEFVRGRPQRLAESTAFQLGREIEQAAAPTFGVDPARDNEFLAQLATAAGEMVPTLAAGAVAGPAGVAFQYGTSAGEAQAQEAIAAGKPEAADIAFLSAAGLGGITEAALGVPGRLLAIANRARKAGVNPGTFGRWANRNPMAAGIARAGAEGALREGAQEGLEQAGQNLIASDVAGYAPDRPVTEGVGRSVALGAILGGLVGGSAAGLNQAQRNQLAAEVRAARGQRIVGYTSEGQPIPAADAVPDPLADLREMAKPTADAPATPGTTVLPDGRVVVVNAETGGTAFPAVSPATPPTAAAPAPVADVRRAGELSSENFSAKGATDLLYEKIFDAANKGDTVLSVTFKNSQRQSYARMVMGDESLPLDLRKLARKVERGEASVEEERQMREWDSAIKKNQRLTGFGSQPAATPPAPAEAAPAAPTLTPNLNPALDEVTAAPRARRMTQIEREIQDAEAGLWALGGLQPRFLEAIRAQAEKSQWSDAEYLEQLKRTLEKLTRDRAINVEAQRSPAPALPSPPTPNPAPVSSSLTQRPEATMESRPAAPLGLQREPTVSPELADTIQALRQGYEQQLDVPAAPPNVYVKPEAAKDIQPGQDNIPIYRQNLRDKTGVMRDWIIKRREADERTAAPHVKAWFQYFDRFVKLYADRPFPETLEQFAAKYAEDFGGARLAQDFTKDQLDQVRQLLVRQSDLWVLGQPNNDAVKQNMQNPLYGGLSATLGNVLAARERQAAPTAPAPKTPPDQSGGPTELTPPAKGKRKAKAKPAEVQPTPLPAPSIAEAIDFAERERDAGKSQLSVARFLADHGMSDRDATGIASQVFAEAKTKPAEVRPAEPGEQPQPPAQAAPAMQGGMDNLRFTSDPVAKAKGTRGNFADAKDAKAKLIAELEKAVEQAKPATKEQTALLDKGPSVPRRGQDSRYMGKFGDRNYAEDVSRLRSDWEAQAVASGLRKVTIEIPGDGTFTVWNTKENLTELLKRAKRLETSTKPPKGYTETGVAKEDRQWVEQMQAAQGKPLRLWEVRYQDWNNNNLTTTVEARSEFEAEDKVGNEVKGAQKILPGTKYVGEAPPSAIDSAIAALNDPVAPEGELFTASAAYPGGALGTSAAPQPPPPTGTVPPAQDREHSVFPLELPELVRLARMLGQGHFPKLKEALRGGKALGVFRYREGQPDSGRIELVRGLWQMVLPEEKAELQRKAEAYANAMVDETNPAERARVAKAKYEADLEALMDERLKQDPILAVKVLAHEIGHWIDFLPQAMIHGRGNLFGHVASLKKFLRHTITWDPKFAELNETGELTEADRRRLREAARRELEKELGPIREIIEKVLIEEPVFATTGVTPEDVKRLFGMDARETMPELYLWFAGLDAATKKEVVKAAMRGMVDARVPASRIQTGTRTVEREVRKVSGRMPTPEEIAARFQAKLREAMEARRMMDINEVKAQLREAITWWRGAPQFEEYFASPEEMYAEAFSIFLANPAALAQRAPKYFNALLNYMDRKPEAAKAYGDLQLAIRQGTLQQQRDKDLLAGFAKDEQRFRDRANDRKPPMDWVDNIVYHMDRRLGPIYRRARGSKLEGTIRGALGDFNYRAAEHERFLSAINREVSEPLVAANLEWADLGYYMFHKRVVEHFDQKAVPLGYSPHSSQKALDAKQAELGPARWAALEAAQRRFMALYQSQVVPLLKTSGLTTPELQELIEDRVFYATFKAVKDDPKDDIERLLAQSYGNGVGSHIYRRVGNVGEVANPATATLMKALSLMSAAYRNNAKRHLPAMLEEMGLPVREVEKTWDKNLNALTYDMSPMGAGSPVQKLVFLENGKPKAYYVETSIAEAFNAGDPIENNLLLGVLAASRGMKRLFTDINYGFWPFAFVRDVAGFGMQMPGLLAPVRYFKNLPKAFGASRDSLKGKPNPLADEALKRKMWIAQADPYGVRDAAENEAELQIAAHGLTPASWEKGGYKAKLAAAWEWYRNWGKVLERTHKLNGMLYLDQHYPELPEWQKQEMVREWAGSPDFLQQPGDRRWINALALFYNPWKESLRSVAKAAKHHPGEFAAKATIGILMPTVLQSLAVMGLLGDDLEEMYKSVGDYDLTNYLVFPLGWEDKAQGKVKYLRFPLWEPARMAHGLLFGQITGRGEKPLSHAGGQVPGLNPLLTATAAWMDYKLLGRNPYDSHYGREILDPDVFKVGGTPADAAMLKWTWNQLGGSVLFRFDTRPELIKNDTPLEKSLKAPGVSNLVGRFLRVSNRGILDADRKVIEPGEQQRARVRLAVDEIKAKLLRREELGQSEHLLLSVDPYARDYLLRTLPEDYLKQQSLLFQRLQRAPNNEAKIKLLTQ